MKVKLERTTIGSLKQFILSLGFMYIGRRINTEPDLERPNFYQMGFQIGKWTLTYKNFETKPLYRNLFVLNIVLFIPFVLMLFFQGMTQLLKGIGVLLFYVLLLDMKQAWDDWGWGGRYLLISLMFWKLVVLALIIYILDDTKILLSK